MSDEGKTFKDEPMVPFQRRWLCNLDGCGGEMLSLGRGYTTNRTEWAHRCDTCGREDVADDQYPTIIYRPTAILSGEMA